MNIKLGPSQTKLMPTPTANRNQIKVSQQIFLSYCRDDKAEVTGLRDKLLSKGYNVWWDQNILPGQDWKLEIRTAMKQSDAVILCLSRQSQERGRSGIYPEVLDAINLYREYRPGDIFLIPVRLSECTIPPIEIDSTRTLDSLQHVDLFPEGKRANGFEKILSSLQHKIESTTLSENCSTAPLCDLKIILKGKNITEHEIEQLITASSKFLEISEKITIKSEVRGGDLQL